MHIVEALLTIINMHYLAAGTSFLFIIHQHQRVTAEVHTLEIIRGIYLGFMV